VNLRGVALLLAACLVTAAVLWVCRDPMPRIATVHDGKVPATTTDAALPAASPDPAREPEMAARSEVVAEAAPFTCTDDDGALIPNPVRDGIVLEVRDADGRPLPGVPIGFCWRKGFGMYGWDRGRTETDGTFATTVAMLPFFESLEVEPPGESKLVTHSMPLPAARDPRRVVFRVPRMATLRFAVVDLANTPLAGVMLKLSASPEPLQLRDNLLAPEAADALTTDASGRAVARLPVGIVEATASIGGGRPTLEARVHVPPNGGEVDLTVPRLEARRELRIEVTCPDEAGALQQVQAWGRSELPRPRSPLVLAFESQQRDYETHGGRDRVFTTMVDALPLRVYAQSAKYWFAGEAIDANQREVRLVLQPPAPAKPGPPTTTIEVHVSGVDGRPAGAADVRLHLTPDLVYGSDVTTNREGVAMLTTPATGKTACVSAHAHLLPFVIAGPVTLDEGRQQLRLQLVPGGTIRGTVVGPDGRPAASKVSLRRPAGPLRQLAGGGPELLPHSASGDSMGTGEPAKFQFHGIGPGEHELWAFPENGGRPARAIAVAGDDVTLRLGVGCDDIHQLEVEVVDADTHQVLPWVRLRVDPSLGNPVRANPEGPFAVLVRDGKVAFTAHTVDHVFRTVEHVSRAGEPKFVMRLEPSPLRFVRVIDEHGVGMHPCRVAGRTEAGAEIQWIDEYGRPDDEDVRTDRHGCAVLRGLPRGGCRLVVRSGGDADDEKPRREFDLPAGAGVDARFDLVWK
jgi:hypothetical protein